MKKETPGKAFNLQFGCDGRKSTSTKLGLEHADLSESIIQLFVSAWRAGAQAIAGFCLTLYQCLSEIDRPVAIMDFFIDSNSLQALDQAVECKDTAVQIGWKLWEQPKVQPEIWWFIYMYLEAGLERSERPAPLDCFVVASPIENFFFSFGTSILGACLPFRSARKPKSASE